MGVKQNNVLSSEQADMIVFIYLMFFFQFS